MKMRRAAWIVMLLTLVIGWSTTSSAKQERKEQPKTRFVEDTLTALGGEHYPEKMKIKKVTSIVVAETYYHIFEGKLDTTGYHVIVYDNYLNYLGFYQSPYPPTNEQKPGNIVIDTGDVDDNGDPLFYPIPIDPVKGLPNKVQLGPTPTDLVKGPEVVKPEKDEAAEGEGQVVPEFREWAITKKGKEHKVRAIYVEHTFSEVVLKGETTGKTKAFPINSLSKDDRAYVQQFK
jgi:hypothetical protein